jgi:tetratricopeptide (TPR) repeat protein
LRGRFLFNRRNEGDLQKALEFYERAVELDSDNVDAWVGLVPLYLWFIDPPDLTRARSAAELALTLDPTNSNAHFRLGSVLYHEGKRKEAMQSAYKALELNPKNATVLGALAGEAVEQGDLELAIEYGRRAISLDPLYITGLHNHAYNLTLVGRLDQAEEIAHRILELAPENPGGNHAMARILLLKGQMDEALEFASRLSYSPTSNSVEDSNLLLTAMAHYSLGNHEASDAKLKSFQIQYADSQPIQMAYLHAWRGEIDEAFQWIDQALKQEPAISVGDFLDPFLSGLHADLRWAVVMAHWNTDDQ